MKNEMNWFSQRIHVFQDPETAVQLQLFIDSGIVKNEDQMMETFHPCRLCITLRDTRVYSSVKYQIDLKYPELIDLEKKFENAISDNQMKPFENNDSIVINKFNGNEKKTLKIEFFISGNTDQGNRIPKAKLSVKVGKEGTKSMQIDMSTISVLYRMVKHITENYVVISTNMSTISMLGKINQSITNMASKMDSITDKMDGSVAINESQSEYIPSFNDDDVSDSSGVTCYSYSEDDSDNDDDSNGGSEVNKDDDKPDEPDEPDGSTSEFEDEVDDSIQQSFDNQVGDLEEYDIGLGEFKPDVVDNKSTKHFEETEKFNVIKIKEKYSDGTEDEEIDLPWEDDEVKNECVPVIKSSFIDSMLNYDASKLNEWVAAWSCAGKNTDPYGFCPLSTIISKSLNTEKFEDECLLDAEYITGMLFKKNLRHYLEEGSFIRGIPVYKFATPIKKNSGMWRIGEEILAVYTGYSFIVSKYINKLKNVNSSFITEMNVTLEYMKNVMLSFVVSMDFDKFTDSDWGEFNDGLVDIFTDMYDKEFFKDIFSKYNEISMGGSLKMSVQMIDGIFGSMINILKNRKIPSYTYINLIDMNIDWDIGGTTVIASMEDVKCSIIENVEADNVKIEDKRKLNLFLQSTTKFLSEEVHKDFVKNIKSYDDVKVVLFNENLPDEIIIIKRIIDSVPNLKNRSDVLKQFKEFREDLSVTESRVLKEDKYDDVSYDTNVEDILFGSELGSDVL